MTRRHAWWFGALAGALGLMLWARPHASKPIAVEPPSAPARPPATDQQATSGALALPEAAPPPAAAVQRAAVPPTSAQDAAVTGHALLIDAHGHFVPTPDARRFFDHFLTVSGEDSIAAVRTRIVAALVQRLPASAALEAIDLLDRYLAYHERVRQLADSSSGADRAQRRELLQRLRREVLGSEAAAALFADEAGRDAVAGERQPVGLEPVGVPAERAPSGSGDVQPAPGGGQARAGAVVAMPLWDGEPQAVDAGNVAGDVRAPREYVAGPQSAGGSPGLDPERAQWQQRLADYRAARAEVEGNDALTTEQRDAAAEDLLSQHFDELEQIRVRSLERLARAQIANPDLDPAVSGAQPTPQ